MDGFIDKTKIENVLVFCISFAISVDKKMRDVIDCMQIGRIINQIINTI